MKTSASVKNNIVYVICLLYILLFVYAAVSKLVDFENFLVQLGQSPLLSAFAEWLYWLVPVTEISIVILLLIPKIRLYGLYSSFFLMMMFTSYIFIILNFSESIPCSCGGILERLGWREHMWFNSAFILLAAIAVFFSEPKTRIKRTIAILTICAILSIGTFLVLYKISNKITRYHNTFIRNFPMAANKISEVDLGYNSYYFAGTENGKIYLGNFTAPLQMLVLENNATKKTKFRIHFDRTDLPFHAVQIRVMPPYFYAFDGTVSCIYSGLASDWQAKLKFRSNKFIDQVIPIDSERLVFREQNRNGSIIGITDLSTGGSIQYSSSILQKQIDGIFDVDGKLLFDAAQKQIIYVYAYRNQFTVADDQLNVKYRGNTIDTIKRAHIKVATLKDRGQLKLAEPPLLVNKAAAVYENLLFINSSIIGRFESEEMWTVASIIDIYNLSDRSYVTSMYVHDVQKKKMTSFTVEDNRLYALVGNAMVTYNLSTIITSRYQKNKIKNLSADSRGRSKT